MQSLERRISKQCFFYSTVTKAKDRTKDIKTIRVRHNVVFDSTVTRTKDIKSMVSFIQQTLELRISKQLVILFSSH